MSSISQKHIVIMKALMDSREPINSDILSSSLGINVKTIKNYYDTIDEELSANAGAHLVSKSGRGVYIEVVDEKKYFDYLELFRYKYSGNKYLNISNTPDSRFLARRFLFAKDYITIDKLSQEMYKSRKSILVDLEGAEEIIRSYHLEIDKKPGKGFLISGLESHIRNMMSDYLQSDVADFKQETRYVSYMENKKRIDDALLSSIVEENISISQRSILKLSHIVFLSTRRYGQGFALEEQYESIPGLRDETEYRVAKNIYHLLDFDMPEKEINYLAVLLLTRRNISSDSAFDIRKVRDIYEFSGRVLDYVYARSEADFTRFPSLRIELAGHLRGLYYRLKYGLEKRGVKVIETERNNSFYEYAVLMSDIISSEWKKPMNEYETAFLAYLFYQVKTSDETFIRYRLCILSTQGKDVGHIIASEIMRDWRPYIESIMIEDSYRFSSIDPSSYDLLITDDPQIHPERVPRININCYLTKSERMELNHFFLGNEKSLTIFEASFDKSLFFKNVDVATKEELFSFISENVSAFFDPSVDIYETLVKREKLCTFEYYNNTAVAHSYTSFSDMPRIMIISLLKPIRWVKQKLQLVIFVINGKNEPKPFSVLTTTREAMNDPSLAYDIINAEDAEEAACAIDRWLEKKRA